MKERTVKLKSVEDAMKFAEMAEKVEGGVTLSDDSSMQIDGKSILGLFSLAAGGVMAIKYPETAEDFDDYLNDLEFKAQTQIIGNN